MKRQAIGLMVALLLCGAVRASGQILGTGVMPVAEIGANLAQNTISAVQNAVTAAQTTLIQLNQILDLTKVSPLVEGGLVEDMALLCDMIKQADDIAADVQSIEIQITVLLDLQRAPHKRSELEQRMAELKRMQQKARMFAFRTQTLVRTMLRTGEHMQALLADLSKLIGNLSGQQRLQEVQQLQNKTLSILATQTAAWHRQDVIDRASVTMIQQSLANINARRLADWPK